MEMDEKDLVETFKGLSPENRDNLLALAHATRAAQENTKKAMNANREATTGKKSA